MDSNDTHNTTAGYKEITEYINEIAAAREVLFTGYEKVMPVFMFLGILGNSVNIFVFNRRCMKALSYFYLRILAFSDLVAVISWSFVLIGHSGKVRALVVSAIYIYFIAINTSTMIFATVSLERFFSLCYPNHLRIIQDHKFARFILGGIVGFNFFLVIFYFIHYFTRWMSRPAREFYMWLLILLVRFIPGGIIIFCNSMMAYEMKNRWWNMVEVKNSQEAQFIRRENRVTKILLYTAILYVTCQLPYCIYKVCSFYQLLSHYRRAMFQVTSAILEKINFCSTFYIYLFTIKKYRHVVLTPIRKRILDTPKNHVPDEDSSSEDEQAQNVQVQIK